MANALLLLLLGRGSAPPPAAKASACIEYAGEVAGHAVPGLPLPQSPLLKLSGNTYGVGGRNTTLKQCLFRDDGARTFGWNWTRGATAPACAAAGGCKAPDCYADFSFFSVGGGVSPWGGGAALPAALPANTSELRSLVVGLRGLSWRWRDDAPGVAPPQTSAVPGYASDSRRARLILDFFVTSRAPVPGGNSSAPRTPGFVTDEVTIDLACNAHFPGSQPPGCLDASSRFGNSSNYGPVRRAAVRSGNSTYDYWYADHHDAVPGTGSRFSSFRRVGAEPGGGGAAAAAALPQSIDLLPFLAAIRREWAGDALAVGAWVGAVNVGTELYDHCSGEVNFSEPPTFTATRA